jgi:hypothetical protein
LTGGDSLGGTGPQFSRHWDTSSVDSAINENIWSSQIVASNTRDSAEGETAAIKQEKPVSQTGFSRKYREPTTSGRSPLIG